MLNRVNEEDQDVAQRVLVCMLYSTKPMFILELAIAISVTDGIRSNEKLGDKF